MELDFWEKRWSDNELGWHRSEYHPALLKYWPKLPKRSRVLVPLCGKTHDLIWLAEQGLQVFGVELSELAAEQFFSEQGLNFHSHYAGEFQHFQCVELQIQIIVGDFFKLTPKDFPFDIEKYKFDSIYDRAALVALPSNMRSDYVRQCLSFLKDEYQGLLITFNYDESKMEGPPFSISDDEIKSQYYERYKQKEKFSLLVDGSPFNDQGFEFFDEVTWVIE